MVTESTIRPSLPTAQYLCFCNLGPIWLRRVRGAVEWRLSVLPDFGPTLEGRCSKTARGGPLIFCGVQCWAWTCLWPGLGQGQIQPAWGHIGSRWQKRMLPNSSQGTGAMGLAAHMVFGHTMLSVFQYMEFLFVAVTIFGKATPKSARLALASGPDLTRPFLARQRKIGVF